MRLPEFLAAFLGIFLFLGGALGLWATIHFQIGRGSAVEQPISLHPGQTHAHFIAGSNARYRIAIEFDQPTQIHFDPRNCQTAEYFPRGECDGIPTGFQGSWTLMENGALVSEGRVPETMWQLSGAFSISLRRLKAKRFAKYDFVLDTLTDGSALNSAKPVLRVYVSEPESGPFLVLESSKAILLIVVSAGSLFFGGLLFGAAVWDHLSPAV